MTEFVADVGKLVLTVGVLLVFLGAALMLFGRLHLPGDILIRRGNLTIYAPLATSLVLSVVLTVLLNLFFRSR
ncbi:MAG: DUF2905 family protein [Chloroflexota bacterium]